MGFSFFASTGLYSMMEKGGGSCEPRLTARIPPKFYILLIQHLHRKASVFSKCFNCFRQLYCSQDVERFIYQVAGFVCRVSQYLQLLQCLGGNAPFGKGYFLQWMLELFPLLAIL